MGHQDVEGAAVALLVGQQARHQTGDAPLHLPLRILALAVVVQHAPSKSHDDQATALVVDDPSIDQIAAEGGHQASPSRPGVLDCGVEASTPHDLVEVFQVVVAVDVEEVLVEDRHDVVVVAYWQIPGTDDEVAVGVQPLGLVRVDQRFGLVSDAKNLHAIMLTQCGKKGKGGSIQSGPAHDPELFLAWHPALLHHRKRGVEGLGSRGVDVHDWRLVIGPLVA